MIQIVREFVNVDVATMIASKGFVQQMSPELRHDVAHHLDVGELVYGVYEDADPIGFAIFRVFGEVLYLSGIILVPTVQGRGIAKMAVDMAHRETGAVYLALRTQSPRMWKAGRKMCQTWLPHPAHHDVELMAAGELVATTMRVPYPVHHGCYGGALYGEKPLHQDVRLQSWWDSICDFERGDAVFCIGRLS